MKKRTLVFALILGALLISAITGCSQKTGTGPTSSSAPSASIAASPSASKPPSASPPSASPASASPSASAPKPSPTSASSPSAPPSPKPSTAPSALPTTQPSASPAPSGSASPAPSGSPGAGIAKDYLAIGDAILQSDGIGSVKINMSENDLIKSLGQPDSKSAPVLWGADGLQHSSWIYDKAGLQINMASQSADKTSIVFSVRTGKSCTLTTARGIRLGDPKDKVLSVYADSIDLKSSPDTNARILVGSVYGGIVVSIAAGAVSELFIGASAE